MPPPDRPVARLQRLAFLSIIAARFGQEVGMLSTQAWLMLSGAVLVVIGILIRWRTARYDLKDAAIDSAWTLARGRRTAENPTALEAKFNEIREQPTGMGRATRAAGTAAGHFASQVLAVVAWFRLLAGGALIALGYFWR
jgi:hypothetical protein